MPHQTEIPITWGDTDAGELIYFPRFFHLAVVGLNTYFEPFVDHLMEYLRGEGRKLPAVDASTSFEAPLRAGDHARLETQVEAGESSLTAEYTVERRRDAVHVADMTVTFVLVDNEFESVALPDSVREYVRERELS